MAEGKKNPGEKIRALVLFSGGLDSILAARLVQAEGVEAIGINFITPFSEAAGRDKLCAMLERTARQLQMRLEIVSCGGDFLEMVRSPRHGYGKNLNPCIDCRIYMLRRSRELMEKTGASFLVTGEVLGERPMSQNRNSLRTIDREAEVEGLVLRPLSARHFESTRAETEGWVKRENLLAIEGRSRKIQLELAAKFGITEYFTPAGGCLLTDPNFSARLKDLFARGAPDLNDIELLKVGRHVRLGPAGKAVIGRNEAENRRLTALFREGDRCLELADHPGPFTLIRGEADEEALTQAAALTVRYSRLRDEKTIKVNCRRLPERTAVTERSIMVASAR